MHNLSGCGPTTPQYDVLICIVVKVMGMYLMQYDCEYAFKVQEFISCNSLSGGLS